MDQPRWVSSKRARLRRHREVVRGRLPPHRLAVAGKGYLASDARVELQRQPTLFRVPVRAVDAGPGRHRSTECQRRPPDFNWLIGVGPGHAQRQGSADAIAATGMNALGGGDHVWTGEVTERAHVHDLASAIDDAPVLVLAPLPPGPADPEVVRLIEGRVGIRSRGLLRQVIAKLTDPEWRRHCGGLSDALLKPGSQI